MRISNYHRGLLRFPEEGNPAGGGTGQPGGTTQNPGTGDQKPEYLSKEEFGKTAAIISGLQKGFKDLPSQFSTTVRDSLVELGLAEKVEEDGKTVYRPKQVAAPPPAAPLVKKPEDDPLLMRVKTLENQLAKEKQDKEQANQRVEEAERNRQVTAALEKAGAVKADRDYVHVIPKLVKNAEGAWIIPAKDTHGFDTQYTLDEYADLFLKENPELRKPQGAGGGSGTPSGGTGMVNGKQVIPKAVWANPSWYAANADRVKKGEISLGD